MMCVRVALNCSHDLEQLALADGDAAPAFKIVGRSMQGRVAAAWSDSDNGCSCTPPYCHPARPESQLADSLEQEASGMTDEQVEILRRQIAVYTILSRDLAMEALHLNGAPDVGGVGKLGAAGKWAHQDCHPSRDQLHQLLESGNRRNCFGKRKALSWESNTVPARSKADRSYWPGLKTSDSR